MLGTLTIARCNRGNFEIKLPVPGPPALQRAELGLCKAGRPKGSFMFLGPTGVGKTETTIAFTSYIPGAEALERFDMSEYQMQDRLDGLVESIARVLRRTARGTLLFDEIEKAHPRIFDLFLQILDAARLTTPNGVVLDLSGFYVVFTSNIASAEMLDLEHSTFATMERHVLSRAQQQMRPELYARVSEKLVFAKLDYEVQLQIAAACRALSDTAHHKEARLVVELNCRIRYCI